MIDNKYTWGVLVLTSCDVRTFGRAWLGTAFLIASDRLESKPRRRRERIRRGTWQGTQRSTQGSELTLACRSVAVRFRGASPGFGKKGTVVLSISMPCSLWCMALRAAPKTWGPIKAHSMSDHGIESVPCVRADFRAAGRRNDATEGKCARLADVTSSVRSVSRSVPHRTEMRRKLRMKSFLAGADMSD